MLLQLNIADGPEVRHTAFKGNNLMFANQSTHLLSYVGDIYLLLGVRTHGPVDTVFPNGDVYHWFPVLRTRSDILTFKNCRRISGKRNNQE